MLRRALPSLARLGELQSTYTLGSSWPRLNRTPGHGATAAGDQTSLPMGPGGTVVVRSKAWGEKSGPYAAGTPEEERGPARRPRSHVTA
jgi:hypothetical protein